MNKRNKGDKRLSSFRSYTDINNYNNFLLELDKTNKENPPPPPVTSFSSQKESVKSFIKSVDKEFKSSDYKNQNFTGISPW